MTTCWVKGATPPSSDLPISGARDILIVAWNLSPSDRT